MAKNAVVRVVTVLLCLVLAAGVALVWYAERKQQQQIQEKYEILEEKVRPYQKELEEAKRTLSTLRKELYYTPEKARYMMGFIASDPGDMEYIRSKGQQYGFEPVVLMDCSQGLEALLPVIEAIDSAWDIMLYDSVYTDESQQAVREVKAYLQSIGKADAGAFLLRTPFVTEENIRQLQADGFLGHTAYATPPACGQDEKGMVYFDYAFVKTETDGFSARMSEIHRNRASTIFIFDMKYIRTGGLSETKVDYYMETVRKHADTEEAVFAPVRVVLEELSGVRAMLEQKKTENDLKAAELSRRIEELNILIDAIYAEEKIP